MDDDTWLICAGDCKDWYASVHPGRSEVCGNGLDDDCDGDADWDDIECEGVAAAGWTAAASAAAASLGAHPEPSRSVSRIGNGLLWILLPLFSFGIGRILRHRQSRKS